MQDQHISLIKLTIIIRIIQNKVPNYLFNGVIIVPEEELISDLKIQTSIFVFEQTIDPLAIAFLKQRAFEGLEVTRV